MKYLIGVILAIFVIIFVIIKLISGGSKTTPNLPPNLASYAGTQTSVRYIIDNPVQASQNHRDIVITVGKDQANLTVTRGYQGEVITSKTYDNNTDAYAAFLLSLDHSGGYTLGNQDKSLRDERGYCATGDRFSYDIIDENGNKIQHYWSTSCKEKTFKGLPDIVSDLFKAQIPDFDALTQDVDY